MEASQGGIGGIDMSQLGFGGNLGWCLAGWLATQASLPGAGAVVCTGHELREVEELYDRLHVRNMLAQPPCLLLLHCVHQVVLDEA